MGFEMIEIKNTKRGDQSINIPKQMKINDDKVYLKKVGNSLFVIPFHDPWRSMFDSLEEFTSDYMIERKQPENQRRESFE